MYSLYRSWLARDPVADLVAVPREPVIIPDVVVAVGEGPASSQQQFAAHRSVLSANSGYFKAALATLEPSCTCVTLTQVSAEAFAPLLTFMYTNYLDISADNIYPVLLATHYLHMPRALDLCWNFLRSQQTAPAAAPAPASGPGPGGASQSTTLVKPIPSRNKLLLQSLPRPPYAPPHMVLPTAEHSPFRSPLSQPAPGPAPAPAPAPAPEPTPVTHRQPDRLADEKDTALSKPRPHDAGAESVPARAEETLTLNDDDAVHTEDPAVTEGRKETTSSESDDGKPEETPSDILNQPQSGNASGPPLVAKRERSRAPSPSPSQVPQPQGPQQGGTVTGKVVVDVACCDGPVRFHRVLNSSYGDYGAGSGSGSAADADGELQPSPPDENHLHHVHVPGAAQLRRARLGKLHSSAGSGSGEYTCLYCNHTFKSHYCYQKHARRHLNPLTHKQGVLGPGSGLSLGLGPPPAPAAPSSSRAPARPLDMNVQYYPCKTCGSKFPSYYFVHKHRKMCHAGEENDAPAPAGAGTAGGAAPSGSTSSAANSSAASSKSRD